jgi:hypothetical protein
LGSQWRIGRLLRLIGKTARFAVPIEAAVSIRSVACCSYCLAPGLSAFHTLENRQRYDQCRRPDEVDGTLSRVKEIGDGPTEFGRAGQQAEVAIIVDQQLRVRQQAQHDASVDQRNDWVVRAGED